jgi:hypothetical protein
MNQWKVRQMHFCHALEDLQKLPEPSDSTATRT